MVRILAMDVEGFRGIEQARLVLTNNVAFVGPNASGKSSIVDALSLVLGRHQLVAELTEHDFWGSDPGPTERIRIVVTLGGFSSNDPAEHPQWFREGRGVEKWWNAQTAVAEPVQSETATELCVQIGYAARFDQEELVVEHIRYFHDDDDTQDPFLEEGISPVPGRLLNEVGFYVLPSRRTWPATISFASQLFRRAVAAQGGIPADSLIKLRDALRTPETPLEEDEALRPLISRINAQLRRFVQGEPELQLRVTATDSDSLLRSLVPHFIRDDGFSVPVARHGTGLISLQTLLLLLEIGRSRKQAGESFILALEEPELHVSPSLQRQLIGEAAQVADQIVCTTHSPRVASFFQAENIQLLTKDWGGLNGAHGGLKARTLAPAPLVDAPNSIVQLYTDNRQRLIEALMFSHVLVPEGRSDADWFQLLVDVAETRKELPALRDATLSPFGALIGIVPTRSSAVVETLRRLQNVHPKVSALVDGDGEGDQFIRQLVGMELPPPTIIQWPDNWEIEDIIDWIIRADEVACLAEINERTEMDIDSLDELVYRLKNDDAATGGLKTHYIVHEQIAAAIRTSELCLRRLDILLEAVVRCVLKAPDTDFAHVQLDEERSDAQTHVYRFVP